MKPKTILKIVIFLLMAMLLKTNVSAQSFKDLDESPHDIAYYRVNRLTPPLVKVIYGRPQKNGQKVFGNLVKYGKIWKTGANEATEVKFYKDILFGNVKVPAGTYVLLTIPGEKEWEVILSSNLDVLGAFQYNPLFDVAKITIPSSKAESIEVFSIAFKEKKDTVQMVLAWDSTRVKIPITLEFKELYAKL
jgi:hypothetical protein